MPAPTKQKPSLAELQDWLRWAFTEPRGIARVLTGPAETSALRRRPEPAPRLLDWIVEAPPIPVVTRLSVYSDAYFMRLLESLEFDFKAVRRALGEEDFRRLAAGYLAATPSSSPNIADLGAGFPRFLKAHALSKRFPFLPELAELEWVVLRCLYTDRLPPFDAATVQDLTPQDWSAATLVLDPTARLLDLEWPVERLLERAGLPEEKGLRRLSKPRKRSLLVYRDDDWAQVRVLEPIERTLLGEILDGKPLGEVLSVVEGLPAAARQDFDLQSRFSDWTSSGILKRVLRAS